MPALDTIQLRRGPAATWTTVNPVLAAGEPGYETDTGNMKVGDGTTAWASLPYRVQPGAYGAARVAPSAGATGINAAGQEVNLGIGAYDVTAGVTLSQQTRVQGVGEPDFEWASTLTNLTSTSTTADAVTVSGAGTIIEEVGVQNTAGTAPTAGAGINVTLDEASSRIERVGIRGFYDGAVLQGRGFHVDKAHISDVVRYGLRVTNATTDHGLGIVSDSFLYSGPTRSGTSAVRWESGGGFRMRGIKIGQYTGGGTTPWTNGLDIHALATTSTGELVFDDFVIDEFTGAGVLVNVDASGSLTGVDFNDFHISGSKNPQYGFYMRASGLLEDVKISNAKVNLGNGSNGLAGFDIDNVTQLTMDGVEALGVPATKPMVHLGSNVYGAAVRMNKDVYQLGNVSWPTGKVFILQVDQPKRSGGYDVAGGLNDFSCGWLSPSIASNSVYTDLWEVDVNAGYGMMVEFTGVYANGTDYVVATAKRLISWVHDGAAANIVTVGTDTASIASMIDLNFLVSGSTVTVQAKIDPGATGVSTLMGYSQLRVVGTPSNLYAYS